MKNYDKIYWPYNYEYDETMFDYEESISLLTYLQRSLNINDSVYEKQLERELRNKKLSRIL
jgi:hypothetical protein